MDMYLFLWCFFVIKIVKKLSKMGIDKNGWVFFFETLRVCPRALQNILLRRSAVELFSENSQCVKPVGCFRRGYPLLIFDGILNVTLPEEVSTTWTPLPLNSLDSHQTQNQ